MTINFDAGSSNTGAYPLAEDDVEQQIIMDLVERECTTYLNRDFTAWQMCILKDGRLRRIGACMGGLMHYVEGYTAQEQMILEMFERHPVPNPQSAAEFKRTNWSIRIGGEMAWASFDQYGPRSHDPFVTVGLSHQVRIFEKQAGEWKIAMLGHGDTSLEYYDFPVIRIDEHLNILWMNESATTELPTHPALKRTGARLHAAHRGDTDKLRSIATEISRLNLMDYRPSMAKPRGAGMRAVLLESGNSEREHIVWVSKRDEMLLVRFNDSLATEHQLQDAQELFALSPAQIRLASLVLEGFDMPASAERLGISLNTAKTHLQRLFDKTGVRSQSALVAKLMGIVPLQT